MKVIDLLNKIANGEEVPLIKIYGRTLRYNKEEHWLDDVDDESYCRYNFVFEELNDEVEVIEEEPRDIEVCGSLFTRSEYNKLFKEDKKIELLNTKHFHKKQRQLARKINEIIDKINEGE